MVLVGCWRRRGVVGCSIREGKGDGVSIEGKRMEGFFSF